MTDPATCEHPDYEVVDERVNEIGIVTTDHECLTCGWYRSTNRYDPHEDTAGYSESEPS